MELFKLHGTIDVDNKNANKALDETSQKGQQTQGKMSKFFSGIGKGAAVVGKAVGAGMVAAGTAVAGLATKAVQSYADYEQLVGGVETLFGAGGQTIEEYAKSVGKSVADCKKEYDKLMSSQSTVLANAKEAYKTAGLSANEYMETVTSFSASLLQSLGGDTEKAAEVADRAIVDMSDNANKMGTSMEMIQNAYNGFAKQNYTMLDNLKLGYGGTKTEMQRLIEDASKMTDVQKELGVTVDASSMSFGNIVNAISVMQSKMGIAGTTAKEASSTISGSIGMMKSSWQNLLTAISSDDLPFDDYVTQFVDSVAAVTNNLMPRIQTTLNGIVQLIEKLAPVIIGKVPELFSTLLPSVVNAATGLINAIVDILPELVSTIMSMLPALIKGFKEIIIALVQALPTIMQALVDALPTLINVLANTLEALFVAICETLPAIIQPLIDALPNLIMQLIGVLIDNLPIIIEALVTLTMAIVEALPTIIQSLVDALPTIIDLIIQALLANLPVIIEGFIQIVFGIVQALPQIFSSLCEAIPIIFKGIWEAIKAVFAPVGEWFSGIWDSIGKNNPAIQGIKEHIGNVFKAVWNNIKTVFNAVKDYISTVWNSIKNVISTVVNSIWNVIKTIFNSIKNTISTVINGIKNIISSIWNTIKTIIANVMNIIFSIIKGDWKSVWQSIKNILNAIWGTIKTIWNSILNNIKSVLSGIWNIVKSAFSGIWNTIKSIVNGVWNTIKSVFNGIKNTVKSVWDGIKLAMTKPIEAASNTIKKIVDKVKGFFKGVKLQFPNVKLPHFGISPEGWKIGDLLKGKIPKLSIKWHAEAMQKPMIMTKPTVFGYDAASGKLLGGGEAGSEVVSGTSTLMRLIQAATSSANEALVYYMQRIVEILADYFPQFIEEMNKVPVWDTGVAAAQLAPAMNVQLWKIKAKEERGR